MANKYSGTLPELRVKKDARQVIADALKWRDGSVPKKV